MAPAVCLTCWATPEVPCADWPPWASQDLPGSYFQSFGAAALRYLVKLSVVPDSSERWNAWIFRSGRSASGLSFLIASSFQLVSSSSKLWAMVAAARVRVSTPGTLKPTAIGPPTIGRSMPWPFVQIFLDASTSSGFNAESEPANAVWPCVKAVMPAPDPVGL